MYTPKYFSCEDSEEFFAFMESFPFATLISLEANRSAADRLGVISGLEKRSDAQSHAVRAEMQDLYSSNGDLKTRC